MKKIKIKKLSVKETLLAAIWPTVVFGLLYYLFLAEFFNAINYPAEKQLVLMGIVWIIGYFSVLYYESTGKELFS